MPRHREPSYEGRVIHIRISEDDHRRLRMRVAELDTSIQAWAAAVISRGLRAQGDRSATEGREADETQR